MSGNRGVQLGQRSLDPRQRITEVDDLADRDCLGRFDSAVTYPAFGSRSGLKQFPQLLNGALGVRELGFQPHEVRVDQFVALTNVGGAHNGADVVERHFQRPETANDLCCRDLVGAVAAVAGSAITSTGSSNPIWW